MYATSVWSSATYTFAVFLFSPFAVCQQMCTVPVQPVCCLSAAVYCSCSDRLLFVSSRVLFLFSPFAVCQQPFTVRVQPVHCSCAVRALFVCSPCTVRVQSVHCSLLVRNLWTARVQPVHCSCVVRALSNAKYTVKCTESKRPARVPYLIILSSLCQLYFVLLQFTICFFHT